MQTKESAISGSEKSNAQRQVATETELNDVPIIKETTPEAGMNTHDIKHCVFPLVVSRTAQIGTEKSQCSQNALLK
jgi:hypothetical protein